MRTPKYRRHSTGKAFVEHGGKRHYLPGLHGDSESRKAYRIFLKANGFGGRADIPGSVDLSLLVELYLDWSDVYYKGNGTHLNNMASLGHLGPWLDLDAAKFGPKYFKAFREAMIAKQSSRTYINKVCGDVRRMFRWAVSEEIVPVEVYAALCAVAPLRQGRTTAREAEKRQPVAWSVVEATLPHVSAQVRAMIRLQWFTNTRPGSVVNAKPEQFDGGLWRPRHKNEWRGQELVIPLGPNALEVIKPWLSTSPASFMFRPYSRPGRRYFTRSYAQAIRQAVRKHGIPEWSPHMLRHARATIIREQFGIEAAQAALAHSSLSTTEIYARRSLELAREVAAAIG